MADREKKLENLAIDIKSFLISSPGGRTLEELSSDYKATNKKSIPFREFGFTSERDVINDLCRIGHLSMRGNRYFMNMGEGAQGAEHLVKLVRTQKTGKTSNFKGAPAAPARRPSRGASLSAARGRGGRGSNRGRARPPSAQAYVPSYTGFSSGFGGRGFETQSTTSQDSDRGQSRNQTSNFTSKPAKAAGGDSMISPMLRNPAAPSRGVAASRASAMRGSNLTRSQRASVAAVQTTQSSGTSRIIVPKYQASSSMAGIKNAPPRMTISEASQEERVVKAAGIGALTVTIPATQNVDRMTGSQDDDRSSGVQRGFGSSNQRKGSTNNGATPATVSPSSNFSSSTEPASGAASDRQVSPIPTDVDYSNIDISTKTQRGRGLKMRGKVCKSVPGPGSRQSEPTSSSLAPPPGFERTTLPMEQALSNPAENLQALQQSLINIFRSDSANEALQPANLIAKYDAARPPGAKPLSSFLPDCGLSSILEIAQRFPTQFVVQRVGGKEFISYFPPKSPTNIPAEERELVENVMKEASGAALDALMSVDREDRFQPNNSMSVKDIVEKLKIQKYEKQMINHLIEQASKPHSLFRLIEEEEGSYFLRLKPLSHLFPDLEVSVMKTGVGRLERVMALWKVADEAGRAVAVRELNKSEAFRIARSQDAQSALMIHLDEDIDTNSRIAPDKIVSEEMSIEELSQAWIGIRPLISSAGPLSFYFATVGTEERLQELTALMTEFYGNHGGMPELALDEIQDDTICATLDEGVWRRAEVIRCSSASGRYPGYVFVRFVDTAKIEHVPAQDCKMLLRVFRSTPGLAHHAMLETEKSSWREAEILAYKEFLAENLEERAGAPTLWAYPQRIQRDPGTGEETVVVADLCKTAANGEELLLTEQMERALTTGVRPQESELVAAITQTNPLRTWEDDLEDSLPDF